MGSKVYRIGTFYRPHSHDQEFNFAIIKIMAEGNVKEIGIIIMGDFNFLDFNWGTISYTDQTSLLFMTILNNFLSQVVDKVTRSTVFLDNICK